MGIKWPLHWHSPQSRGPASKGVQAQFAPVRGIGHSWGQKDRRAFEPGRQQRQGLVQASWEERRVLPGPRTNGMDSRAPDQLSTKTVLWVTLERRLSHSFMETNWWPISEPVPCYVRSLRKPLWWTIHTSSGCVSSDHPMFLSSS